MTTPTRSPLGAFYRSPLGVRGGASTVWVRVTAGDERFDFLWNFISDEIVGIVGLEGFVNISDSVWSSLRPEDSVWNNEYPGSSSSPYYWTIDTGLHGISGMPSNNPYDLPTVRSSSSSVNTLVPIVFGEGVLAGSEKPLPGGVNYTMASSYRGLHNWGDDAGQYDGYAFSSGHHTGYTRYHNNVYWKNEDTGLYVLLWDQATAQYSTTWDSSLHVPNVGDATSSFSGSKSFSMERSLDLSLFGAPSITVDTVSILTSPNKPPLSEFHTTQRNIDWSFRCQGKLGKNFVYVYGDTYTLQFSGTVRNNLPWQPYSPDLNPEPTGRDNFVYIMQGGAEYSRLNNLESFILSLTGNRLFTLNLGEIQ